MFRLVALHCRKHLKPKIMDIVKLSTAAALLFLGGCASLSEEQCNTGDWYGIGFSDGASGRNLSRLEQHQESCADYGVAPQLDLYQKGRGQGLLQYCTAANGYRVGSIGNGYEGVCDGYGERDFLRGYQAGGAVYQQKQQVRRVRNSMRRVSQQIDELAAEEETLRSQLVSEGLKRKQRQRLLDQLDELDWRHNELLREHDALHIQLAPEQRYLQELKNSAW